MTVRRNVFIRDFNLTPIDSFKFDLGQYEPPCCSIPSFFASGPHLVHVFKTVDDRCVVGLSRQGANADRIVCVLRYTVGEFVKRRGMLALPEFRTFNLEFGDLGGAIYRYPDDDSVHWEFIKGWRSAITTAPHKDFFMKPDVRELFCAFSTHPRVELIEHCIVGATRSVAPHPHCLGSNQNFCNALLVKISGSN